MHAIVVLGMHRSGTSCLAGMLAAAGLASAGDAIRNWDNARGHHEMLDLVRLDEAVLAYSGGHWLSPPRELRWTEAHAVARDALLRARIAGRPVLLKDPRMLLVLPFWRASPVAFHAIGIVRHPLAVARSLESWRGMSLAEGIALWTAHARELERDHAQHGYPLIDFDAPKPAVVSAVAAACRAFAASVDEAALTSAFEEQLVHHDDGDAPEVPGLADGIELHRRLIGAVVDAADAMRIVDAAEALESYGGLARASRSPRVSRSPYPRDELVAFSRGLACGDLTSAVEHARTALASVPDAAAVLVPVVTAFVRSRAWPEVRALIADHAARLDDGLAELLLGKVALAAGDATRAVEHLEAACAVQRPYFQARHLLPQALRAAGRGSEARSALQAIVGEALYPHGPLATLAEWSWLDREHARAVDEMREAIAAAPPHRRGRLRTRLAEWLVTRGEPAAARVELEQALVEDPAYARSRDVLRAL